MATRVEAFKKAIADRIGNDKNHGWGADDSLHVIVELVSNETGEVPDGEWQNLVKKVINPSQFRQMLEASGRLAPSAKKIDSLLQA